MYHTTIYKIQQGRSCHRAAVAPGQRAGPWSVARDWVGAGSGQGRRLWRRAQPSPLTRGSDPTLLHGRRRRRCAPTTMQANSGANRTAATMPVDDGLRPPWAQADGQGMDRLRLPTPCPRACTHFDHRHRRPGQRTAPTARCACPSYQFETETQTTTPQQRRGSRRRAGSKRGPQ
jgi:hypothetical protein